MDEAKAVAAEQSESWTGNKGTLFFGILSGVLMLDVSTKLAVQTYFIPYHEVEVIGDYVRFTYIHNPGAAFGIKIGEYSRQVFLVLSVVALTALLGMYWFTPAVERVRLSAIALICGGAVGNLIDRVRSSQGVIDFIDVGVGAVRWPVFNIADIAVTSGAIILALSLWKEEQRVEDAA